MSELIRDKVPNFLKQQGLNPDYVLLDKKDGMRKTYVRNKFNAVSTELDVALKLANPETILLALAKTVDIIRQIAKEEKISLSQLQECRQQHSAAKGSYNDFVVLHSPNKPNNF